MDYGNNKIKIKGSSILDQKKEPALRAMMTDVINAMLEDRNDDIVNIYHSYIKEALDVKDIRRWSQKKTVTESVTSCADPKNTVRKNEMDIWKAIKDDNCQQGDKVYIYPVVLGHEITPGGVSEKTGKPLKDKVKEITGLKMDKYWTGDHDVEKLVERVYSTMCIFELVLDMSQIIDYGKKSNKSLLAELK
jgi:hypothetical protein